MQKTEYYPNCRAAVQRIIPAYELLLLPPQRVCIRVPVPLHSRDDGHECVRGVFLAVAADTAVINEHHF